MPCAPDESPLSAVNELREFYPPLEPYDRFFLPVSPRHTVYVEQCGNPQAPPIVFLHGGPGGGLDPVYRRFFDPTRWRIILFDQRGAGQSTPFAELRENTTWDLVADMEAIRERCGLSAWAVFGGSWGSTLALAYAQTHPDRVRALILRGIFLLRQTEIDWFYEGGASRIFPDAWQEYLAPLAEGESGRKIDAYYRLLTSPDEELRRRAARAWSLWEGRLSKLRFDPEFVQRYGADRFAEAFARIECHYFVNRGFLESDDQLLVGAAKLRGIPGAIVHGRYDLVCPLENAWQLHKQWPQAELHIIEEAGHSAMEPGVRSRLIELTDRFADLV